MSSTETHSTARRTAALWLLLILATLLTWHLGENQGGGLLTAALLGIALIKGLIVAFDFMALRHAPPLWRILVGGWLLLVCALIGLAFWKGSLT
ncbi:MAG: cytochrome C oxidase subunit IV family protein [Dechloromonas sp.]|nr:cytochrome C oxidase subunit IV family protein [Dechloromonas sp.]